MKVKMKIKKRLILIVIVIVVIVAGGAIYKHQQDVKFEKAKSNFLTMCRDINTLESSIVYMNPDGEYIPISSNSLLSQYTSGVTKITRKNYNTCMDNALTEFLTFSISAGRYYPYQSKNYTVTSMSWYINARTSASNIVTDLKEKGMSSITVIGNFDKQVDGKNIGTIIYDGILAVSDNSPEACVDDNSVATAMYNFYSEKK